MNEEANNRPEEKGEEGAAVEPLSNGDGDAVHHGMPGSGGMEEMGALLQKLDEATVEINAQKERYLRTVADLENYRKRALREKEEVRRQANAGLVEDLLPVLDNFQLGLKSAESYEGGDAIKTGFKMIFDQMSAALRQNGVEEMNPQGQPFDPNFHEAIAHLCHDSVPDGHIIEVQRVGYKLHERLLRAAAVIISSGPARSDGDARSSEESEQS